MLPINPAQIPQLYQKALALQNKGKLESAMAIYGQINSANPRIAEVHFQVGRIYLLAKQYKKAVPHFIAARQIKPNILPVWQSYAETLLGLGDQKQISGFLKELKASSLPKAEVKALAAKFGVGKSKSTVALNGAKAEDVQALVALMRAQRFSEAESRALALVKRYPKAAILVNILASAQASLGKTDMAITGYRRAIDLDPNYAESYDNLGRILLDNDDLDGAVTVLKNALALTPNNASAHNNLGRALTRLDRNDEAENHLRKAIKLRPDLGEAQYFLGILLAKNKNDADAIAAFRKSIDLGYDTPVVQAFLARALGAAGQEDEALAIFDAVIANAPDYAFAHTRKATLLQTRGEFDLAEEHFRKSLALEPENGDNYRVFGASYKILEGDPLLDVMKEKFSAAETTDENRKYFGFALAKAMEDNKKYDQVFQYLRPANRLMRKEYPYNIEERRKELTLLKQALAPLDPSAFNGAGITDSSPIFVTGMPRSGTTLVEQIIASHSRVTGAGEVGEFSKLAYSLLGQAQGGFRSVQDLKAEEITRLGRDYTAHMKNLLPAADIITDKSIQTYTSIGLLRMALPRAKIIVVRRDPRDNLLSIYKNMFLEGTHLYAYDLSDLGIYYRMFEDMLDFWRELLPDSFYEIYYDKLIANPEKESRKLIAACGLEWQEACLNFHQNKRRVDTLSVYQVRQPIYKSSVKAWQRYENELQELFAALEQPV